MSLVVELSKTSKTYTTLHFYAIIISMLAQKYRFHSRGGVNYVYQKGKTTRTQSLALIFAPNQRGFQRFAVVVSKKVLKSAVGRNRIRRRLYEAIRHELPSFSIPMDCIFVVYSPAVAKIPFRDLRRAISELLNNTSAE